MPRRSCQTLGNTKGLPARFGVSQWSPFASRWPLWHAGICAGLAGASVLRRSYEVSPSHRRNTGRSSRALRRWHEWRWLSLAPCRRSPGALVLGSCRTKQAPCNSGRPFSQALARPGTPSAAGSVVVRARTSRQVSARAALSFAERVSPNPSIERTCQGPLRAPWPAAHVKR